LIKNKYKDQLNIVVAPGPEEIKDAKQINATCVLNNDNPLNISQLATLIKDSSCVIANDTGPAHIASHLNKKGLVLFGSHTSAKKVSIENFNFKSISVKNLNNLNVETVLKQIKTNLN
jgi:ADP-heptose:LPS heptosyltransferase